MPIDDRYGRDPHPEVTAPDPTPRCAGCETPITGSRIEMNGRLWCDACVELRRP